MSERITNGTFEGPLYSEPEDWTSGSNCEEGTWGIITVDEDLGDGENSCVLSNYGSGCGVVLSQSVDFTNVDELTFLGWFDSYQRLGPPNGYIHIYAGDDLIYEHTTDDEDWREYSIDVSSVTGTKALAIRCGPYADVMLHHVSAIGSDLPPAPVAAFSASPLWGWEPLEVQFTDESTNTPTSWLWGFGDAWFSAEQNPLHTYAEHGVYTVSLKATNAGGESTEIKVGYITVLHPPEPTPEFSPLWSLQIGPL